VGVSSIYHFTVDYVAAAVLTGKVAVGWLSSNFSKKVIRSSPLGAVVAILVAIFREIYSFS